MAIKIDVYSDYVCPYCLLFEAVLSGASQSLAVDVQWCPFELRPEPTPTLRPEDPYLPNVWNKSVYPLASDLDVLISLPTISPQPYTRLAHEGFQYAKLSGKAHEYSRRVFSAFFQEDRDIGLLSELTQLAWDVGLNKTAFRTALEAGEFSKAHDISLQKAIDLGVNSVPSVFIEGQRLQTIYAPETMRSLLINWISAAVANPD